MRGASTIRTLTYDAAGNIATDARSGTTYGYTYNRRNRLQAVSAGGIPQATYVYDANEQLAIRDSLVAPAGVTHYVHDIFGNIIAETAGGGATGATGTVREYPRDKPEGKHLARAPIVASDLGRGVNRQRKT